MLGCDNLKRVDVVGEVKSGYESAILEWRWAVGGGGRSRERKTRSSLEVGLPPAPSRLPSAVRRPPPPNPHTPPAPTAHRLFLLKTKIIAIGGCYLHGPPTRLQHDLVRASRVGGADGPETGPGPGLA
ncbi:hypothetical protein TcasGA2_TC031527 [Tribolium castaneum]|uniref:Uncharacterized protein n=1 Tax=Tribolium castaneum TaxID=7070 RepID=A0A139WPJ2_TRICA|nr:hypothetical protein TcasGA2_TC031527 [Tribolium castaneum]